MGADGHRVTIAGSVARDGDAWTYALATADAVIGGAIGTIVEHLTAHDLVPTVCQLVPFRLQQLFSEQNVDDPTFYIQNPGARDVEFSLSMHDELYGLAPACVLMVTTASGRGGASEAMLRCKGATRPESAAPGSIRHLGENVIFNLIHCPDDGGTAIKELSNIFGREAAGRLISLATSRGEQAVEMLGLKALLSSVPSFSGKEAISFPAIVNRVRRRLVQRLCVLLEDSHHSDLLQAHRMLSDEQGRLAAAALPMRRLLIAQDVNDRIHATLVGVAAKTDNVAISAGLDAITAMFDLYGPREPEAIFALSEVGIYISPLEKVVIQSHSYAFRPSDELEHIYGSFAESRRLGAEADVAT